MVGRGRHNAGFTLAELMVVVVIVAILATLAVVGIRGYVTKARQAEAASMIQSIRAAQEAHKAETNTYLDVSSGGNWYPHASPSSDYHSFHAPSHGDYDKWAALNPTAPGQGVRWVYVTRAGPAGTQPGSLVAGDLTFAAPLPQSWYVVEAWGDTDGDGSAVFMAAASVSGELYRSPGAD